MSVVDLGWIAAPIVVCETPWAGSSSRSAPAWRTLCSPLRAHIRGSPPASHARSAAQYALQLSLVQLVVVLLSAQLYSPSPHAEEGESPFGDAIMACPDATAAAVAQSLLRAGVEGRRLPILLRPWFPTDTQTALRAVLNAAGAS